MRLKLVLLCLVLILSVILTACISGKSTGKSIEVSCDDFYKNQHISKQLDITAGDKLTVILCSKFLCSCASPGPKWSASAQISDSNILKQTYHEHRRQDYKKPTPPDTLGQDIWTFETMKAGTSDIYMEYDRSFEGGETGEWTFKLTVVVK